MITVKWQNHEIRLYPLICTCDKCMQRSERNRQMNKNIYDVLSIPDVTFFPHECCTTRARVVADVRHFMLCFRDFWFRMGGGSLEEDRSCSSFFLIRPSVEKSKNSETDVRRPPKKVWTGSWRCTEQRINSSDRKIEWHTHHILQRERACAVCARSARTSIGTTQRILSMEQDMDRQCVFYKTHEILRKVRKHKMNARTFWTDGQRWQISQISVRYLKKKKDWGEYHSTRWNRMGRPFLHCNKRRSRNENSWKLWLNAESIEGPWNFFPT